jgi:hypothetical protein
MDDPSLDLALMEWNGVAISHESLLFILNKNSMTEKFPNLPIQQPGFC